MKKTWLIQRLEAPRGPMKLGGAEIKDNPFCFGGGYKNGGLSDTAMDLIRNVFAFDYMGASEYEWGEVPKAIDMVAKACGKGELCAFTMGIQLRDIKKPYDLDSHKGGKKGLKIDYTKSVSVYAVCQKAHKEEVCDRIRKAAADDLGERDGTQLNRALYKDELEKIKGAYVSRICGWLELDNGFFFTTDKDMYNGLCKLFTPEIG